jgi:Flp pilus assembly protein TadD
MVVSVGAEQQSNNPNELAKQGCEAIQVKRYGEALTSFTAATDQAPEWAGLWYGRGYAEYLLGRDGIAEQSLRRSIELDGTKGNASWVLGELLYRVGRVDQEIKTYETGPERRRLPGPSR